MKKNEIKGVIVPILTPIDREENIDIAKLRRQVNFVIDGGVHGILAFGSNGEFYMFDYDQTKNGLENIIDEVRGRVPVFLGIGAIQTKACIKLAKLAYKSGANGISVLQPMFLKLNDKELYRHFEQIAGSVPKLPVLIYNNPGRTGYSLSSDLVYRLSTEVQNIVGIKDSSGDFTLLTEYIRVTKNNDFKVMSGKDNMLFGGLCMGTVGGVCSIANVLPDLVVEIYEKFEKENYVEARNLQYKLNPIRLSQDYASFPVATKDMCNILGMDVGKPVLPSLPSRTKIKEIMKNELEKAGYLDDNTGSL